MAEPFVGEIKIFPYNFVPRDWAYCNGQEILVMQYQILYAVIGNLYGGSPQQTMALPNMKGRVPLHKGQAPELSNYYISEKTGIDQITLTTNMMPEHNHTVYGILNLGDTKTPLNNLPAVMQGHRVYKQYTDTTNLVNMSTHMLSVVGAEQAHENRQPYLALPFFIALDGTFPARN